MPLTFRVAVSNAAIDDIRKNAILVLQHSVG